MFKKIYNNLISRFLKSKIKSIEKSFTTCIFLNTENSYDVFRFKNILAPSITFLENKILVVNKYIDDLKEYPEYKIILDDEIFISNLHSYNKQMMLKLYVSKFISTTHYLILDTDIYVNKKFEFNDFFKNGKITLSVFDCLKYFKFKKYNTCQQTKWLFDTFRLQEKTIKDIEKPLFYGVTPALLITQEVKNLLQYLENKYGDFLKYYESNDNCGSEYTNYYVYINKKKLYCSPRSTKHFVSAVWSKNDSLYKLNKKSYFWVIQSTAKIDNEHLFYYLKIKDEIYHLK